MMRHALNARSPSLVLDGQSLINHEIFANSYPGGIEGTLFAMLNRCITRAPDHLEPLTSAEATFLDQCVYCPQPRCLVNFSEPAPDER
ncbi:hypothetical protein KCU62_g3405, partial [Aureobasidium sp. EXF-3399]